MPRDTLPFKPSGMRWGTIPPVREVNWNLDEDDATFRLDRHTVGWYEYSPGNGTRYSIFVTALPADIEGGRKDSHVLVTIYSPYQGPPNHAQTAYVFSVGQTDLALSYLAEKFPGLAQRRGDFGHTAALIGQVLQRPVIDNMRPDSAGRTITDIMKLQIPAFRDGPKEGARA